MSSRQNNNNNSFDQRRQFLTSSPTSSTHTSSPSSNSSRRQRSIHTPLPSSSLSPHSSHHHSATRSPSSTTHGSSALHSDSYFSSSPSGFTQIPNSPTLSYRTQASEFRPYLPKNRGTSFSSNRSFGSDDGSNPLRSSGSSNGSASPTSQRSIEQAQRRAEHFRDIQDSTPRDPKDDSVELLSNNVYVNGLDSSFTDQDLLELGSGFGNVLSHKAIICEHTGDCKGFGFILYSNRLDAQNAINALTSRGLTASTANESYRAKFRRLSDRGCSNVYVSNLPLNYTMQDLERMCLPYTSSSSRIITDNSGISKGVGFMRFESRETAGRVIKSLHLKDVDGSSSPLQARFADSEAQKRLRGSNRSTFSSSSSEKTSGVDSRASRDQEFRRFSHPLASRDDRYRPEEMIRSRSPQDPRYTILQRGDEQDSFSSNQNRRSTGSPSGFLHRGQFFDHRYGTGASANANFSPNESSPIHFPNDDAFTSSPSRSSHSSGRSGDYGSGHYSSTFPSESSPSTFKAVGSGRSLETHSRDEGQFPTSSRPNNHSRRGPRSANQERSYLPASPLNQRPQLWSYSVLGSTQFSNGNQGGLGLGLIHSEFGSRGDFENQSDRNVSSIPTSSLDSLTEAEDQLSHLRLLQPNLRTVPIPTRDAALVDSLATLDIGSKQDSRSSNFGPRSSFSSQRRKSNNGNGHDKSSQQPSSTSSFNSLPYEIDSRSTRQAARSDHTERFGLDEKIAFSSPLSIATCLFDDFEHLNSSSSPPLKFDPFGMEDEGKN